MVTILVVDDNTMIREQLAHILNNEGYSIITASHGKDALEKIIQMTPSLIITDQLVPTIEGYEFVEKLREKRELHNIPVVFYTTSYPLVETSVLEPNDSTKILTAVHRALGYPDKCLKTATKQITNLPTKTTHATLPVGVLGKHNKRKILDIGRKYFQEFSENISDVFWVINPQGNFIYVSPAFINIWGSVIESLYKDSAVWFDAISNADRDKVKRLYSMLIRDKKNLSVEYKLVRPDGSVRYVYDRGFPIADKTGKLNHALGITTDITERKNADRRFETQYVVSQILSDSNNLEDAAPKVLRVLSENFNWKYVILWMVKYPEKELNCIASWRNTLSLDQYLETLQEVIPNVDIGLSTRVLKEKRAIWIADIKQDKESQIESHSQKDNLHGVCGFPIMSEGEVLGVIEFFSDRIVFLDEELFKLLSTISAQLGVFTKKKYTEIELEHLAHYDILTGLANRAELFKNMKEAFASAKDKKTKVAILFLDLDRFKLINDTHGHEMGDAFLKVVGERLRARVRKPDFIARLGGDEFVIVLSNISKIEIIHAIAAKILEAISIPFFVQGHEFFISTSIGISLYPDNGLDVQTLLSKADIAMYQAKDLGGNNFQFCTPEMIKVVQEKAVLEEKMAHALREEEFILLYQPKYDLHCEKMIGVEALLYWKQDGKILAPREFLPLAEETGLIIPIGTWVFRTACAQLKVWQKMGFTLSISVNLSSQQLIIEELLEVIMHTLRMFEIAPQNLEIEITESMLMKNTEGSIALIHALKNMGMQIAIDDFGTGYSSLMYLKRFKVHRLKIDQSFIHGIPDDAGDVSIAKAIIALSHSLGIKVIAEGVETKGQLDFLKSFDCDEIQGYYFSRPLTADKLTAFLLDPPKLQ